MGKILKDMLKTQEFVIGGFQQIPCAEITDCMCVAGFDFLILDMEHSAGTIDRVFSCMAVAAAYNVPVIVRVNDIQTNLIEQALDCGAQGILVPTVETVEQCKLIVDAAKYAPMGKRGWCPVPYAHRWMNNYNPDTYTEDANRDTFVSILIETPLGMQNLPEILKVEGIDAVQLGNGDLAIRLGKKMMDPEVVAMIQHANELIKNSDKYAIPMVMETNVASLREQGIKLAFSAQSDFVALERMSEGLRVIRLAAGIEDKNAKPFLTDTLYKAPDEK